ncbi:helix-turn-helix domain-containing protein [Streptococcus sp. 121]|uniref:helix-turn-helix domain-containing protein n=1 Tax=Streptococcus sp. 121 TaxID=2797637 RepID=UPI001F295249|nr:helix-turn-helix transcriptional regulator [Streptococcus sp. 121]
MGVSCYGKAFRKIRKERKVSLKEAAGDIISPQLLSQFELGKKNVSLSNFDQLLASVGISLLEFARVLELENRKTSIYENMYEKSGGGDFQGIISTKFSIEN